MDCLSSAPLEARVDFPVDDLCDIVQWIEEIKQFKADYPTLFDALMKQSIFDFVSATVMQEQIIPKTSMFNVRENMMKFPESQNLWWMTDIHLKTWGQNDQEPYVLTIDRLKTLHQQLMQNVSGINTCDKGRFCTRGRYSTYKGQRHCYPRIKNHQEYVRILEPMLEEFNKAMAAIFFEKDLLTSVKKSVYLASWIFYQITSLHPFVDGNGRTARVLASRCFPQLFHLPVFIWSKITPVEIQFVDTLIDVRTRRDLTGLDNLVWDSMYLATRNVKWRVNQLRGKSALWPGAASPTCSSLAKTSSITQDNK